MSKAVLVIDKPNCCGNCELIVSMYSEQYEEWYEICHITQKKIFDTEKIDKECPLKMLTDMTSMINVREDDYIKRKDAVRIMAKYMMNTALIDKPEASDRIEEWESNVVAPIMSKLISNKDVVEVVRCKDCRRRDEKVNGIPLCPIALVKERAEDNDFCSYGERAEQ